MDEIDDDDRLVVNRCSRLRIQALLDISIVETLLLFGASLLRMDMMMIAYDTWYLVLQHGIRNVMDFL